MLGDTFGIGQLFSLSRDGVIFVRDGVVASMNPAAAALFDGDRTGAAVSEVLPDAILSGTGEDTVTAAVVEGRAVTISRAGWQDLVLYCLMIPTDQENHTGNPDLSPALRDLANTIKAAADQLSVLARPYQDEKLSRYAAMLRHSSSRLKRLVVNQTLVENCRQGAQLFSPVMVSANEVCGEVVDAVADLAADRGILVEFSCGADVIVPMDVELIRRMLLDLLCNSLQHAPSDSTVRVELRSEAKYLSIHITDEGPGIPPELLPRLFQLDTTPLESRGGSLSAGLGLAVADSIAKLHGGAVVLRSTPGKGTSVVARIQRSSQQRLKSPRTEYRPPITDAVMTELSPWLTWRDYLMTDD